MSQDLGPQVPSYIKIMDVSSRVIDPLHKPSFLVPHRNKEKT